MFNGFDVTLELVWDLVELYGFIERREWAEMVPSSLPVYLISGDCDPCGNYGEGLYHVANLLAESGNKVSVKAYRYTTSLSCATRSRPGWWAS